MVRFFLKVFITLGVLYCSLLVLPIQVLFRKSETTHFVDSLPDIRESNFSSFEGAKISPLENYYSGHRNDVFYLYGKNQYKLMLEYYSTDSVFKEIEIVFLQNNRFVYPKFLKKIKFSESNKTFRFQIEPGRVLRIPFEIPFNSFNSEDFRVVINSFAVPFYNPLDSVVYLNSPTQIQTNIVGWFYVMKNIKDWKQPDTVKILKKSQGVNVVVLKRKQSLAIVNQENKPRSFVICQPEKSPIFVNVKSYQSATFRNILTSDSIPLVVMDNPNMRLENVFKATNKKSEFSFYFSKVQLNEKSKK